jgi:dienelactone hydrolase
MQRRMLAVTGMTCTLVCGTALSGAAASDAATSLRTAAPGHYSGTLADGATWIADVPAAWNGTLLLFSHGFGPLTAQDAPSADSAAALLAQGYALAGSSYDPNGSWWALGSAEKDQFATLSAFSATLGAPRRTLSAGESMGGLVNSQIAEDGAGRIDGAVGFCGLVAGGADLNDYQLNAEYAITALLPGGAGIRLRDYATPEDGTAAADALAAAVAQAQGSAAGRARIALAAALLNETDWAPGQNPPAAHDYAGQEAQEYAWLTSGQLQFIESGRYFVDLAAGGDSGSNLGVAYERLIRSSGYYAQIKTLYRQAGLSLDADLRTLDSGERLAADPGAPAAMRRTSANTGRLAVPLLDVHTTSDQLVPVEQESAYAAKVAAAGRSALLRRAYVARQGHCNFTTAEFVAAIDAVERRVASGRWPDTGAGALNAAANSLGLDGASFTDYRAGRLVVQNTFSGRLGR